MNYNKEEILYQLRNMPIDGSQDFCKEDNPRIADFLDSIDYEYEAICYGASKLVIIPVGTDYVIKIPYTGILDEDDFTFDNFTGIIKKDNTWDYCAAELIHYQVAVERKINNFLAEIVFIGFINDYPIYIQEKAITYDDYCMGNDYSRKEKETARSYCRENGIYIDTCWLVDFNRYHKDPYKTKELFDFVKAENINDLSFYNVGIVGSRPVLVDYSGFFD